MLFSISTFRFSGQVQDFKTVFSIVNNPNFPFREAFPDFVMKQSLSLSLSLRPLSALSPPSLRPLSPPSPPSLRPLSALSPPSLRPLSALSPPSLRPLSALRPLRPLSALSPPSLRLSPPSLRPLSALSALSPPSLRPLSALSALSALSPPSLRPLSALSPPLSALSPPSPPSLRPLSALSPPSLRPLSALSPPSLRPLSALSPPSLRPLSALSPPSLRPLSALSPPSLRPLSALSPPSPPSALVSLILPRIGSLSAGPSVAELLVLLASCQRRPSQQLDYVTLVKGVKLRVPMPRNPKSHALDPLLLAATVTPGPLADQLGEASKRLQSDINDQELMAMIGSSGSGKTASIYSFLAHHFGILLIASTHGNGGSLAPQVVIDALAQCSPTTPDQNGAFAADLFLRLVFAYWTVLAECRQLGWTPLDCLLLQLYPVQFIGHDIFALVYSALASYPHRLVESLSSSVTNFLLSPSADLRHFPVFVDEAQVLAESANLFSPAHAHTPSIAPVPRLSTPPNSSTASLPDPQPAFSPRPPGADDSLRPAISPLAIALGRIAGVCTILSGTGLRMSDHVWILASAILKPGLHTYVGFGGHDSLAEVRQYLEGIYPDAAFWDLADHDLSLFIGRNRFAAYFLAEALERGNSAGAVGYTISHLVSDLTPMLKTCLATSYMKHPGSPNFREAYGRILLTSYMYGRPEIVSDRAALQLVELALARLIRRGSDLLVSIGEPLLLHAYCQLNPAPDWASSCLSLMPACSHGFLFERIMIPLLKNSLTGLLAHGGPSFEGYMLQPTIPVSAFWSGNYHLPDWMASINGRLPTPSIFLCDLEAGPDIACAVTNRDGQIRYLKFVKELSAEAEFGALLTLDPERVYHGVEPFHGNVLRCLADTPLMRILIVLGGASARTSVSPSRTHHPPKHPLIVLDSSHPYVTQLLDERTRELLVAMKCSSS
ncbi:hypothetical protein PAPYR_10973 [Paratrimastix pyriformis]|uniref:Uncharacterized protein n=1 Tax=Paratrimastix pyriformis TaxID=342808 RepID=A0ABQ8U7P0_9EUKA|nr:hypothetical protein PAPYR_10973 [Paratrimastix pyriformis]